GDALSAPFLSILFTMGTSTFLPWGVWPQAVLVGVASLSVFASTLVVAGLGGFLIPPALAVFVAFAASIYVAPVLEHSRRGRKEAERRLRGGEQRFRPLVEGGKA